MTSKKLGLLSGVGLCAASMIGSGVFLSAGFMAQELSAGAILLAWVVGAALAMAGARAYAEVARLVPRSGGEYRYLSELLHPALGYVAGWATLVLGFAAPIAINALAAVAFLGTLVPIGAPKLVAAGLVIALSVPHAVGVESSTWTQNLLVAAKVLLLAGFLAAGLLLGDSGWPSWEPARQPSGGTLAAFMGSLFYVSYAFSGWNTTAYAAEEFRRPRRDVPRAMLIACAGVGVYYLAVNWVFVANLTPASAATVIGDDSGRATLGHLVARDLLGGWGGAAMSVLATVSFVSAMSAMILCGPRVAAQMAKDGYLPAVFAARTGRPPSWSVAAQAALAVVLLAVHTVGEVLATVAAVLVLFSALTAASLFGAARRLPELERPTPASLVAAGVYVASSAWMLYFGFRDQAELLPWLGAVTAVALASYALTRRRRAATSGSR